MDSYDSTPGRQTIQLKNEQRGPKDGGKIGGGRVHFSMHTGETLTPSTEEQIKQPTVPQRL